MIRNKKLQFFYIGENKFSSKWVYGEQYLECKYSYDKTGDRCPSCGKYFGDYVTPLVVKLSSKENIGDFIFGTFRYGLVSEKFKVSYKNSKLSGIKEFRDVDLRFNKKEKCELKYYYIVPERITAKPVPLSARYEEDTNKEYCEVCSKPAPINSPDSNKKRTYWYLSEKGLVIDTKNINKIPDIFLTFISGSSVYCTQEFVDFCHKNNFTNFENQIVKVEDYTLGNYQEEKGEYI
jgi:hypothetical protein